MLRPSPPLLLNLTPTLPTRGLETDSSPVHQADIIEVDTIKNKQADIASGKAAFCKGK